MTRLTSVLLMVILIFVLSGTGLVAQQKPLVLQIGHILAPGSLQNQALVKVFKPYVEEHTNGAIRIEVFPNEQLGHAPDQVQNVATGVQAMFMGSQTWWEAFVPEVGVATIPFIFDSRDHFHRWIDEVFVREIVPQVIAKANQRFINLRVKWHRGPFRVICSKKPVFTPKDIEGLRLRLWPARMIQLAWRQMGASVHSIDFAETYLALQQGIVDAVTTPLDLARPQKFTEVAKFVTELRQFWQLEFITINEDIWQSLSEEQRQILLDGADAAGEWFNEHTWGTIEETIDEIVNVDHGYYIKVPRQPFVDKCRKEVVPALIKAGYVKEEWVQEIDKLR